MNFLEKIGYMLGFKTPAVDDLDDDDPDVENLEDLVKDTREQDDPLPPMATATETPDPVREQRPAAAVTDMTAARQAMMAEVDRLNIALKRVQAERDAAHQAQMSAERQKTALSDRLSTIDRQLVDIEAEKDKLYDENRRLRIALRRADPNADVTLTAVEDVDKLLQSLEAMKMKATLSDNMIKELQSKAAKATRELQEAHEALDQAHRELEAAGVVAEQVQRFADYKEKYDLRVAELQRTIAMRDKQIDSLNDTINHNLAKHGEIVKLLEDEITRLREGSSTGEPRAADDTDTGESGSRSKRQSRRQRHVAAEADPTPDSQLTLF